MSDALEVLNYIKTNDTIRSLNNQGFLAVDPDTEEINFHTNELPFQIKKLNLSSGYEGPLTIRFNDLRRIDSLEEGVDFMLDDCFGIESPKIASETAAENLIFFLNGLFSRQYTVEIKTLLGAYVCTVRIGSRSYDSAVKAKNTLSLFLAGKVISSYGKKVTSENT